VDRQFRLDRPDQPYPGGDLGGEVDEGHRRMIGVQLDRGLGGRQPLLGPGAAQVVAGCLGDDSGELDLT
jgi:hypothetical protein